MRKQFLLTMFLACCTLLGQSAEYIQFTGEELVPGHEYIIVNAKEGNAAVLTLNASKEANTTFVNILDGGTIIADLEDCDFKFIKTLCHSAFFHKYNNAYLSVPFRGAICTETGLWSSVAKITKVDGDKYVITCSGGGKQIEYNEITKEFEGGYYNSVYIFENVSVRNDYISRIEFVKNFGDTITINNSEDYAKYYFYVAGMNLEFCMVDIKNKILEGTNNEYSLYGNSQNELNSDVISLVKHQ